MEHTSDDLATHIRDLVAQNSSDRRQEEYADRLRHWKMYEIALGVMLNRFFPDLEDSIDNLLNIDC